MISAIFLGTPDTAWTELIDEAPELLEREGVMFSLRGGPRRPRPTDREWNPVAVYAPDELTEEEFQDWFEASRAHIVELNLKY